jgi:ribose/xylose/arabinose/galactoside ABC-type transport system permease subunit
MQSERTLAKAVNAVVAFWSSKIHRRNDSRDQCTARRRIDLGRFRELSLIPAIGVLMLIGFIVSPAFLTADNLIGVLQQSTELSLLVLATALILICGRMDLSLEFTIGVAPVIAVWLVLSSSGARFTGLELFPAWMAVPLCLLAGAVIGAFNGSSSSSCASTVSSSPSAP